MPWLLYLPLFGGGVDGSAAAADEAVLFLFYGGTLGGAGKEKKRKGVREDKDCLCAPVPLFTNESVCVSLSFASLHFCEKRAPNAWPVPA